MAMKKRIQSTGMSAIKPPMTADVISPPPHEVSLELLVPVPVLKSGYISNVLSENDDVDPIDMDDDPDVDDVY